MLDKHDRTLFSLSVTLPGSEEAYLQNSHWVILLLLAFINIQRKE